VLTHDSIAVGEDGPTHQPVEQLPSLRMMPNLNVFRPCNAVEVVYAWRRALREEHKPTAIVLSRQKFVQVPTPLGAEISRGAYIIRPSESGRVRVTLLATGSEVPLAVRVAERLGRDVQVVSVPSVADFRAQNMEYKSRMLSGFVVAIEAAASAPWFEFADAVVGIDKFGASGPGDEIYSMAGFNVDAIVRDIKNQLK
jgi:transketolase